MYKTKHLECINDFPKVGLLYMENSGENLIRYYLENLFKIKTDNNIKKEYYNDPGFTQKSNKSLDCNWIVASDFPTRNKNEYESFNISSGILLIRNPIDLIMSKILRESYFLDEALAKIDEMIDEWKAFNKYWINSPIPILIVRYEDLVYETNEILKVICKFLLGIKTIENTKLEFSIQQVMKEKIDRNYYAYDVEGGGNKSLLNENNAEKIQNKFYGKLDKI